jgi:F420-dependent oxidoreductase-like protein
MKLGVQLGYWMGATPPPNQLETVLEAEQLGYDSAWFAEAYGSDCFSPLCWFGSRTSRIKLGTAVMQISARTPACTAMTAATIDHLSGGRLILGIGVSGPQVVEGWYGQPFPKPLARTREYIGVLRDVWRREAPVENPGPHYPMPLRGGTGLGKPLKLILHPLRREIPIYMGAEGPKNVALCAEIADGWLPLFVSPFRMQPFEDALAGAKPGFEIAATVIVSRNDDLAQALMPVKMMLGFYLGGMGARSRNFHVDLLNRMGFEEATGKIQDLFFAGKRAEAVAAIPDEMADEIALCGSDARIRDRLSAWEESRVTTLLVGGGDVNLLRFMAEIAL